MGRIGIGGVLVLLCSVLGAPASSMLVYVGNTIEARAYASSTSPNHRYFADQAALPGGRLHAFHVYVQLQPTDPSPYCFYMQLWRRLNPLGGPLLLVWQSEQCMAPGQGYSSMVVIITEDVPVLAGDLLGWTCRSSVLCPIHYDDSGGNALRGYGFGGAPTVDIGATAFLGMTIFEQWSIGVEVEVPDPTTVETTNSPTSGLPTTVLPSTEPITTASPSTEPPHKHSPSTESVTSDAPSTNTISMLQTSSNDKITTDKQTPPSAVTTSSPLTTVALWPTTPSSPQPPLSPASLPLWLVRLLLIALICVLTAAVLYLVHKLCWSFWAVTPSRDLTGEMKSGRDNLNSLQDAREAESSCSSDSGKGTSSLGVVSLSDDVLLLNMALEGDPPELGTGDGSVSDPGMEGIDPTGSVVEGMDHMSPGMKSVDAMGPGVESMDYMGPWVFGVERQHTLHYV